MGDDSPSTTTQINKTELPPWVDQGGQENYDLAKTIASKPYEAYTGQRIAGLPQQTLDALKLVSQNAGKYDSNFTGASTALQSLLTQANPTAAQADKVTAGQVAGSDLSKYLNPYTDNVIQGSLADLEKQRQQTLNSNSGAASSAGAFGGSRQGVTDAITNTNSVKAAGDLSSNLRKSAYDNATSLLTGDLNRTLAADTTNSSNQLATNLANLQAATSGNANKVSAAKQLTDTGTAGQASSLADISSLLNAGNIVQGQDQKGLDQQYSDWLDAKNYDTNNLNLRLAALGMTPYGKTETSTKTTDSGGGSDWATAALGGLSLLKGFGMFSDDDSKTDIEKVGKVPGTSLTAFAYRYKSDPKTYPKIVGLMASDVEKKVPKAVTRFGKKRVVNYEAALAGAGV